MCTNQTVNRSSMDEGHEDEPSSQRTSTVLSHSPKKGRILLAAAAFNVGDVIFMEDAEVYASSIPSPIVYLVCVVVLKLFKRARACASAIMPCRSCLPTSTIYMFFLC